MGEWGGSSAEGGPGFEEMDRASTTSFGFIGRTIINASKVFKKKKKKDIFV